MKKAVALLSFVLFVTLLSCTKESQKKNNLQEYANTIKIYPIKVYAQHVILSFVETFSNNTVTAKFQFKKVADSNWADVPYTDMNNIPVPGLSVKSQYEARVELSKGAEKAYSPVFNLTTQSYDINYQKFFAGPAHLHDDGNNLFSIEGAHHIIYGSGFMNESSIKVTLTAIDNLSDILVLPATILSDSTLSFDIPGDLIVNSPYVRNKIYSCMIGSVPLVGYSNYMKNNYSLTAEFVVVNRDINIDKFTVTPSSCPILTFGGNFATNEAVSAVPASLFGLSILMKERKMIIQSGGTLVKEISMDPVASALCDSTGSAVADPLALGRKMFAYHEITLLTIRTKLAAGSYTARVKQTAQDGTVFLSNEFPFTL